VKIKAKVQCEMLRFPVAFMQYCCFGCVLSAEDSHYQMTFTWPHVYKSHLMHKHNLLDTTSCQNTILPFETATHSCTKIIMCNILLQTFPWKSSQICW